MPTTRAVNTRLAALIAESGWSFAVLAAAVMRVASENGVTGMEATSRSHISRWASGTVPSGRAPEMLCEALSRRLGRRITPADAGFAPEDEQADTNGGWDADTLAALADLGRIDIHTRRDVLATATYQLAALAVPPPRWWQEQPASGPEPLTPGKSRGIVGQADLAAVTDTTQVLSRLDQRRGGGRARTMVGAYLTNDVAAMLAGPFVSKQIRRAMFSAAAELAYVGGWTRFDNSEHGPALKYFQVAAKLAATAGDEPLAGHILRAMAHQAIDLGHVRRGLQAAQASIDGQRYLSAAPREKALLGIVHAKALGADGQRAAALAALMRAENDLSNAADGDSEPDRVFFFGEAALAMESACTLRDLGDLAGAEDAFRRSVRLRSQTEFTRTHAVTLGYLGSVQIRRGHLEEACATWDTALTAAQQVTSGRTRAVAAAIRTDLSPFRRRGSRRAGEVDARAKAFLETAS